MSANVGAQIALLITISVSIVVILVLVILFVVKFSHPDDNTGVLPKIIAIIGITFATISVLIIPFDVANTREKAELNMEVFLLIFLFLDIIFIIIVFPFTLIFFNSLFVNTGRKYLGKRLKHAFIGVLIASGIFFIITVPLFLTINNENLNFIEYCIAVFTFIAWFLFAFFVGVGLIALPLSLFLSWYNRPLPITLEKYEEARVSVGNRARKLRESGEILKKEIETEKKYFKKNEMKNKFLDVVKSLKNDYTKLQVAYHLKGGNPIWPWVLLVLSVITAIISILWLLQICIFIIPPNGYDFLNILLSGVNINGFDLFGIIFFAIFALFLFWASVYGLYKIGAYIPFITAIYPLEYYNTYSDAFIVNAGILVLISLPVISLSATAFSVYADGTSTDKLFNEQIAQLSFFTYFFDNNVFIYIILGVFVLTIIFLWCFPPNTDKKLEEQLNEITKNK